MGIAERHYVRERGPGGGPPGGPGMFAAMRMWSANTWIIALCVAVFVLDSFMPILPVPMDVVPSVKQEVWNQIDQSKLVASEPQPTRSIGQRPIEGERYLFVQSNLNQPVAKQLISYMPAITKYLHFSTQRGFLQIEFWRFVGFQFLHANIWHILFNMMGLFFFGALVERYLGAKRYVAFYLLCGICGALMYTLLNVAAIVVSTVFGESVHVPGLLFSSPWTPLVGASAGVFGVLMAGAYLAPKAEVLLFFFLPMQLRTLAYALVVIAFFTVIMDGNNAGGEAGHLGGAIAGFYFIRHPHHLHNFFDFLGWIDPTSHHYRDGRAKRRVAANPVSDTEIDRILDKIRDTGLQSLTAREKQILKDASRES